jgi:hypothetical protein
MAQSSASFFETESVSGTEWSAIALVLVTGVIHIYVGIVEGAVPLALAGLGFFGAIVLYLANYRRRLLYLVGIVFTGVQIPLWYVVKAGEFTTIGYVDKAVQVVLVVLLAYLYWTARTPSTEQRDASQAEQTR